ncbi:MAG: LLM class flavin-dependent oxidoreductase [Dehalococcoidia bacterium]
MAPKLGLILPTNWGMEPPPTRMLMQFSSRAEELGFDSLWIIDRLFHEYGMPHPFVMLSYAAAATDRIGLGSGVVLLSVRHPVEVAQAAATLNAMSGERLTLGVSLGGRDNEYAAMNMPKEQRAGRLVEGVRVMRRLWTETNVDFAGRYYNLEGANIEPKPQRAGGIPVVFGAVTDDSLARAGRMADGWMQGARGTPESFGAAWAKVRDAASAAGRDVSQLQSSKLMYVNPGSDVEAATTQLQDYLTLYYGPNYPMENTAVGPPEAIAAKLKSFGEAGCDLVMMGLPGLDLDKLDVLGKEVAPLVAASR